MEHTRQKSKYIFYTAIVLLCLVMISLWLLCNMYARYSTSEIGEDNARVARFVFDLSDKDNSQIIDLQKITKPGDTQTYQFVVANEKDGKQNETKTDYTIQLKLSGTMPLTAEIKKTDDENSIITIDHTTADGNKVEDQTSNKIEFLAGQKTKHDYELTVTWPEDQNDERYANKNAKGNLEMIVKGEQIN